MPQKGSKKQPVKFLDKDTQYLKNKLFDVIKTLNEQAINKWQQCMLVSQSGKKKFLNWCFNMHLINFLSTIEGTDFSLVLIYISMISLKVNLATTVPYEMGNNLNKLFKLTFYKGHHCWCPAKNKD